ncbi:MAG: right-handed parallel beta-helix repeat-containing protein [Clostridiaceae bacterium]|nr:right-handed parallel beta-helix repeat-containing protein [Clostridiaceae bacterium]
MMDNTASGPMICTISAEEGLPGLLAALDRCRNAENDYPATIRLEPGRYFVDQPIRLGPEHRNLTLSGPGARLIGGKALRNWQKVTDPAILCRLDPEARGQVLVCDLNKTGISALGGLTRRGWFDKVSPSHAELFLNGEPLDLAQYPKKGQYLTISGYEREIVNECEQRIGDPEASLFYQDARPGKWQVQPDLWAHGYWCWDWANSYEHVTAFDSEKGSIRLGDIPKDQIRGFNPGQRFCFLNLLEEVNQPGSYYIDRQTNQAYLYPPLQDPMNDPQTELIISLLDEPLIQLQGCEHITIQDVEFSCVRGHAVSIQGGRQVCLDNCVLKNIGNTAVELIEGSEHTVQNCTIYHCGDGGIRAFGGDRLTLEPAGFRFLNNHIYQIATWSRCYKPGILAMGVGMTISHNLIHDCPHSAVLFGGNDILITDNEIYRVCLESGDAGAIYAGRDVTFRGNQVSHNFIHHLGGVGMGTMGIYNDDVLSGTVMENNFFYEVGRAVMLGGGVDFIVRNNVFVKCYPAIALDCRGAHTAFFWGVVYEQQRQILYNGRQSFLKPNDDRIRLDCTKSPYIDRYPELGRLAEMYESGRQLKASAVISNNIFCTRPAFRYTYARREGGYERMLDCGEPVQLTDAQMSELFDMRHIVRPTWSAGKGDWRFTDNFTAFPEDFRDAEWADIEVKPDSQAFEYGYTAVSFQNIGLQESERVCNPIDVQTSLTYPYRGTDRPLTLGIRNRMPVPVHGEIRLVSDNPKVSLSAEQISFDLAAYEERAILVGDLGREEVFTVEAQGVTPGVRPARAVNLMGRWKRF